MVMTHQEGLEHGRRLGSALGIDGGSGVILDEVLDVVREELQRVKHLEHARREDDCPFVVAVQRFERSLQRRGNGVGGEGTLDERDERVCQLDRLERLARGCARLCNDGI